MFCHCLKVSRSFLCCAKGSAIFCSQKVAFSSKTLNLRSTTAKKVASLNRFSLRVQHTDPVQLTLQGHLNLVRHYGSSLGDPGPDLLSYEDDRRQDSQNRDGRNKPQKKKWTKYNQGLTGKGKVSYTKFFKGPSIPIQGEILFGIFPVLLALREARRKVNALHIKVSVLDTAEDRPHIKEIITLAKQHGIEVSPSDVRDLNTLSAGRPHQGVCLDADKFQLTRLTSDNDYQIPHSSDRCPQLWLVLDSIQDPMNFGAILRSSYFLGVDEVITVKDRSCPPSPVVSKASAGVLELLPVCTVDSITPFIQQKKSSGWHIIGTVGVSDKSDQRIVPLGEASLNRNTILLMGNEGKGLEEEVEAMCDSLVTIRAGRPLVTNMESLNVSVATGIVLHHLLSQRYQH